jgi:hypothetical protein
MGGARSNYSGGGCSWPGKRVIESEQEPRSATNIVKSHSNARQGLIATREADQRPGVARRERPAAGAAGYHQRSTLEPSIRSGPLSLAAPSAGASTRSPELSSAYTRVRCTPSTFAASATVRPTLLPGPWLLPVRALQTLAHRAQ